jgi:cleavage stimulation factor subunit 3
MFDKFLNTLAANLETIEARTTSANSSLASIQPPEPAYHNGDGGTHSAESSFVNSQSSDGKTPKPKELTERRSEYGLVYIMYMRFGRRAEGLKASRTVFARARRDKWIPWEVYEASGGRLGSFMS